MNIRSIISRRRRSIYMIALLVLTMTNLGVGHAATDPVYGVLNGSFGFVNQCSLDEWTSSGVVKVASNSIGNCFAYLKATSSEVSGASAKLEQTFSVDPANPTLIFYLQPFSNNPGTAYAAQTVSVYDNAGNIIYQQSRNLTLQSSQIADMDYDVTIDLSNYADQSVRLSIEVKADGSTRNTPTSVRLNVDFDHLYTSQGPETTPGPGW